MALQSLVTKIKAKVAIRAVGPDYGLRDSVNQMSEEIIRDLATGGGDDQGNVLYHAGLSVDSGGVSEIEIDLTAGAILDPFNDGAIFAEAKVILIESEALVASGGELIVGEGAVNGFYGPWGDGHTIRVAPGGFQLMVARGGTWNVTGAKKTIKFAHGMAGDAVLNFDVIIIGVKP